MCWLRSPAFHAVRQLILKITVTDTGCGIPEEKLQTVFEEFEQVDGSAARRHDGAGLGLAITKSIVEVMGGTHQRGK